MSWNCPEVTSLGDKILFGCAFAVVLLCLGLGARDVVCWIVRLICV